MQYQVRIEDPNGVLDTWNTEEVPYAIGDTILLDPDEPKIVGRVWDGPRKLILRVEGPS